MQWNFLIKTIITIILLFDIGYSFSQYHSQALDGDMANIILPANDYDKALEDPFGFKILMNQEKSVAPSRYFAHQTMSIYFKKIPLFLQNFVEPIESIYLASALFKILLHLLLLYLLAAYISHSLLIWDRDFLIAALLITPLFQTTGFTGFMGIIYGASTYSFFYSLPLALLLLFFLPFYRANIEKGNLGNSLSFFSKILLVILMIILAFNGPLVSPIVLIICPLLIIHHTSNIIPKKQAWTSLFKTETIYYIFFSLLCLYSFYIGTFNLENGMSKSLIERYLLLPKGLFYILTTKIALPLLLLAIIFNALFLAKQKENPTAKKLLTYLKWILVFSMIYLILLPLGGYRSYRPNIVRADTFLPITLCLIYFFGISTLFVTKQIQIPFKQFYYAGILIFLLIYKSVDLPNWKENKCERLALQQLSESSDELVKLKYNCTVMFWHPIHNKEQSKANGQLLKYWNVTEKEKLYWQE